MSPMIRVGRAVLNTLKSIGEICALGTLGWALLFPDEAAIKWAQFQIKVQAAEERLVSIDEGISKGNDIATAIAASNRAIEASNLAIEASGRAVEVSNLAISASNDIIAMQAQLQTDLQQKTENNTKTLATETTRLSSIVEGIDFGAFTGDNDGLELGVGIANSSTRSLSNVSFNLYANDGRRLLLANFGRVTRNNEAVKYIALDEKVLDRATLSVLTACIYGRLEGGNEDLYLKAKLIPSSIASFEGMQINGRWDVDWIMDGAPEIFGAPSEICAS